jgi:fido (protein-threonine AMPylation protein)
VRCKPRCRECIRLECRYPNDELPDDVAPCGLIDRDLLEYLERRPGAAITFTRALEIEKQIQANAFDAELMVATARLGAEPQKAIDYLLEIHRRLFSETEIEYGGRFRRANESVYFGPGSKRQGAAAARIVEQLTQLFDRSLPRDATMLNRDQVSIAGARLLYDLLEVHPFVDGNGRAARYMFKAFVHATGKFVPLAFQTRQDDESEMRYLAAIQDVDQDIDNDVQYMSGPSSYAPLADYLLSYIAERDDEEGQLEEA